MRDNRGLDKREAAERKEAWVGAVSGDCLDTAVRGREESRRLYAYTLSTWGDCGTIY